MARGLDYLVNNAGAPGTRTPYPRGPRCLTMSSGQDSADQFAQRVLDDQDTCGGVDQANGAVVNTVSVAAFGGGASSTAYATAKAGLVGLTRELARGLAPAVRVNGIAPGYVNSNWSARSATWTQRPGLLCHWRASAERKIMRR